MNLSGRVKRLEERTEPTKEYPAILSFPTEEDYREALRLARERGTRLVRRGGRVYIGVDLDRV